MYISAEYDKLRLLSSNFINISPLKGLDIRSTFSIDIAQQENDTYYPTNSTQSYKGSYDGQAVQYRTKSLNWQWDNTVNYSTIVQDRHRIDVTLGMNASYYSNNWNEVKAVGFGNDLFTFKNLGGAAKKEDCSLSSGYTSYSLMSVFLRANYVYDSRYYITFTGRGDGSSKFGPTHKWGFFPSVAASWNITGEEFMKQQNNPTNHIINAISCGNFIKLHYNVATFLLIGYTTVNEESTYLGNVTPQIFCELLQRLGNRGWQLSNKVLHYIVLTK
jgi:hypothetical protein